MAFDRFFIGPMQTGLQKNLRPFLIAEDAFEKLQNAYVFRGRVRKRFGEQLMGSGYSSPVTEPLFSRLRINIGTTDGSGNFSGTVPGTVFKIGQEFSVGDVIFTVYQTGTPAIMLNTGPSIVVGITDGAGNAAGVVPGASGTVGQSFIIGTQSFSVVTAGLAALATSGPGSGTFNTGTGAFTFAGAAPNTNILWVAAAGTYNTNNGAVVISNAPVMTIVYFYPGQPVMGLCNYQNGPINNQPSYAFDTQFAYLFTNGAWQRSGTVLLTGTNLNFVETCNYRGSIAGGPPTLFISNFKDPIWYTQDGSTWVSASGANAFYFAPAGGLMQTGPFVVTARLVISFKNRLLLLNTIENNGAGGGGVNTSYTNRVRYSFNGSPFARNAWYEPNQTDSSGGVVKNNNIAAGAGFIDATTEEQIISAEFIKDRLIVYFERSTWELAYTGNYVIPFVWQKINTELGSEAQFSTVPFDTVILTMGTTGVHACSGANVERIDTKIPDQVFQIQNKNLGVQRVYGVRDYFTELVYWTFPSTEQNSANVTYAPVYPTQILIYNYRNDSWAIFTDCITAFGYFEQQNMNNSITWNSTTLTWETANMIWNSGVLDANFRQVIAGNQQGYTFICNAELSRNARAMQITNMVQSGSDVIITCVDHTLTAVNLFDPSVGDFVILENFQGCTLTNNQYPTNTDNIYPVSALNPADPDKFKITNVTLTGVYTGGGTVSRVSNINILSKQWNPYLEQATNVYLARIDFGVEKTAFGQLTVDYYPSASQLSMLNAGINTGAIMGTGVLETYAYPIDLYPLEQEQDRLWHPIYFQSSGECIQILMYMAPNQINIASIAFSDFELDGMTLHTSQASDRLQ